MTRQNVLLNNFTSGELTSLLDARQDIEWYRNGTRAQVNMISTPHGPAFQRSGFGYVARAKFDDKRHRQIPFRFNTEAAYNLEVGDLYIRFFKAMGGQIAVPETDAVFPNGTFDSDIAGWTDKSGAGSSISHHASDQRLNLTSNGTTSGYAEEELTTSFPNQVHVIAVQTFGAPGDEIRVRVGTATGLQDLLADRRLGIGTHLVAFTPTGGSFFIGFLHNKAKTLQIDNLLVLASGGDAPLELPAPYTEAQLRAIKYTQSADILYLRHPDAWQRELRRYSDRAWSLQYSVHDDGPYLPENDTGTTLQPAATSGLAVTVTASAVTGINEGLGFLATDLYRSVRILHSGTWGWGVIVEVTSTTQVKVDIRSNFGATTAVATWRLGLYGDTLGHPAAAMFHEQRLWEAAGQARLGRYDATKIGGFGAKLEFAPGTTDADPISGLLDSNEPHPILWLHSMAVLVIGTGGGEARIGSFRNEDALTPTYAPQKFETFYGSADVAPVRAGDALLFWQEHGRKLREMVWQFEKDGLVAPDMTRRSEHITQGGVLEMAYAKEPWSIIWCVRADGVLLGFTYLREEGVTAWHRHTIGGGAVETVSTVPGDGYTELWIGVRRTVGGQTIRTVERLAADFGHETAQEDAFFVDGGVTYNGAATSTITGLGHLEGLTVDILADGEVRPQRVVSSGEVTLDRPASKVHVGIHSRAILSPVRIEAGARLGTAQGRIQKINIAYARLYRSRGVKIGRSLEALDVVPMGPGPVMGDPPPLFTGDLQLDYPGEADRDARIYLVQDNPEPLMVLGIIAEVDTHEGG